MPNYRVSLPGVYHSRTPAQSWNEVTNAHPASALESLTDSGVPGRNSIEHFPCVFFEAKPSLEIVWVSKNINRVLGLQRDDLLGQPEFWKKHILPEDWCLFQEKLNELVSCGAVSFIHRLSDVSGLPVWITHSLCKVEHHDETLIHGCLVPNGRKPRMLALDQDFVAHFIHKLGNHFQLLNLIVNSIKERPSSSRDRSIIQDTLDQLINVTRIFSDCNQALISRSAVPVLEIARSAAESRITKFAADGTQLLISLEEIPDDTTITSDAYFLETALGHLLENAHEAINGAGIIEFGGRFIPNRQHGAVRIYVKDNGCGIPAAEVERVVTPFHSTKKGHDGLGLTVASRIIELHGGTLRIQSREGKGTEVEIILPTESRRDVSCS